MTIIITASELESAAGISPERREEIISRAVELAQRRDYCLCLGPRQDLPTTPTQSEHYSK